MDTIINGCDPSSVHSYHLTLRIKVFVLYFLCLIDSYILMLIIMTFNAGLFVATMLGLTAGYFIFGLTLGSKTEKLYNPETDKCCT